MLLKTYPIIWFRGSFQNFVSSSQKERQERRSLARRRVTQGWGSRKQADTFSRMPKALESLGVKGLKTETLRCCHVNSSQNNRWWIERGFHYCAFFSQRRVTLNSCEGINTLLWYALCPFYQKAHIKPSDKSRSWKTQTPAPMKTRPADWAVLLCRHHSPLPSVTQGSSLVTVTWSVWVCIQTRGPWSLLLILSSTYFPNI